MGSLWDVFLTGGWVMWPLLALSVIGLGIAIERAFVFLLLKPGLDRAAHRVLGGLRPGEGGATREDAERAAERHRQTVVGSLRQNLWVLGTIGSAAPFVGLRGTVLGIVRSFHDMGEKGVGGFNVVAAGISEALVATAAGLIVAILALMTYNIFVAAANQTVVRLRLALEEALERSFGNRSARG